jgi:hypothetical protein
MKKRTIALFGMGATLVLLVVAQAIVANSFSTVGVDVSSMQNEILTYKKENSLLKEKLLTRSSLTEIAESMEDSGYITAKTQLSFSTSSKLARR